MFLTDLIPRGTTFQCAVSFKIGVIATADLGRMDIDDVRLSIKIVQSVQFKLFIFNVFIESCCNKIVDCYFLLTVKCPKRRLCFLLNIKCYNLKIVHPSMFLVTHGAGNIKLVIDNISPPVQTVCAVTHY